MILGAWCLWAAALGLWARRKCHRGTEGECLLSPHFGNQGVPSMFCLGRRPFQGLILSGCHCPQNSPGLGISRHRLQVAALQESRARQESQIQPRHQGKIRLMQFQGPQSWALWLMTKNGDHAQHPVQHAPSLRLGPFRRVPRPRDPKGLGTDKFHKYIGIYLRNYRPGIGGVDTGGDAVFVLFGHHDSGGAKTCQDIAPDWNLRPLTT